MVLFHFRAVYFKSTPRLTCPVGTRLVKPNLQAYRFEGGEFPIPKDGPFRIFSLLGILKPDKRHVRLRAWMICD